MGRERFEFLTSVTPTLRSFQNITLTSSATYNLFYSSSTVKACQLIEVGFEYVTGEYSDGGKIFRKRR